MLRPRGRNGCTHLLYVRQCHVLLPGDILSVGDDVLRVILPHALIGLVKPRAQYV